MGERKHTPGPWEIDARPFVEYGRFHISCGHYIVATAMGQMPSCEYEAEANAHLIASAPDLLEALERLVAWKNAVAVTAPELGGLCSAFYNAEAAIARAQGKKE